MIYTDLEESRYELSSKFCEKLGDDVVTVRAVGDNKKAVFCMQSSICGGCDMPKGKSAADK